jgi:hypothetical protein
MEDLIDVDFNFIIYAGLKAGLSVEETLVLASEIGLIKGVKMGKNLGVLVDLEHKGLVKVDYCTPIGQREKIIGTPEALKIFRKEKKDNPKLASELRKLFPVGMKDNRWPWRSSTSMVCGKLNQFNKIYPDITDEEILQATKDYLEKFDDSGRSLLVNFIVKDLPDETHKSILADWVYMNRDEKKSEVKKRNIYEI